MSRFRLQYLSSHVELPLGEFSIGRSSACSLSVVDTLVSRQHARLHVGADAVIVEDLGSRNGVVVNGEPIEGLCELKHMDRMFVGSQELTLIDGSRVTDRMETSQYVICEACGGVNGLGRRHCGKCGWRFQSKAADTIKDPPTNGSVPAGWDDPEDTCTAKTRDVISGIAAKAIQMGRYEEAERMLIPKLDRLLERAMLQQPLGGAEDEDPDAAFATATGHALHLAEGLRDARWIDWVFRIHLATGRLMDAATIEAMHTLVRNQDYRRRKHVRTYLQAIQERASEFGASERFLASRIEGLAQVISTR